MSIYTKMFLKTSYQKLMDREFADSSDRGPKSSTTTNSQKSFFSYRTAFFILFAVYIITLLVSLNPEYLVQSIKTSSSHGMPDVPFDQPVLFTPDLAYEKPSNGIDDGWSKLLPLGRGFIKVPTEIAQHDGTTKVENKPYCISMFHQLHCIAGLKWAFEIELKDGLNSTSEKYTMKRKHLAHCFDYLRQAVMCAGDMTLESTDEDATDGWNTTHQCKNYRRIYDFAEERRFSNNSGIM